MWDIKLVILTRYITIYEPTRSPLDRSVGKNAASSRLIVRFEIPDSLHQPIKTLKIHLWPSNLQKPKALQAVQARHHISQVHKVLR